MLTKVACPHCKAVLRSNKPLPVGLQVKCVKCQKPFAITGDASSADCQASAILVPGAPASADSPPVLMSESMAGTLRSPMAGSHAGVAKSPLAGSQAGTARSPLAGSHAGAGASAVAAGQPPPSAPVPVAAAAPLPTNGAPLVRLTRPPQRSRAGAILAVLGGLAALSAVTVALVLWCFREENTDRGLASSNKKAAPKEVAPPPPPPEPETKPPVVKEPEKKPEPKVKKKLPPEPPRRTEPAVIEPPPPISLVSTKDPATDQRKINEAIEKGVRWLRDHQTSSGSWLPGTGQHSIGHAALPALALLECQVAAGDPAVQKAAKFVREHCAKLPETYDLGLAVLFLDRLGDPRDRTLIHNLAMRLVAGQNAAGGWDYHCPILSVSESQQLLTYLQKNRPQIDFFNLIEGGPKLTNPIEGTSDPKVQDPQPNPVKPKVPPAKKDKAARPDLLPPNIRGLAVIANQTSKVKGRGALKASGRDDNSNTQFALLGLWAARRHEVPTEFSLELTDLRFQQYQNGDGGWGYALRQPTTNSMTCVGLLGLAMGHGSAAEAMLAASAKGKVPPKASLQDQFIQHALEALGQFVDMEGKKGHGTKVDLYFLWSLERVAVLYNLKTIGKKDWYAWGSKFILDNQKEDGRWRIEKYEAPIDTSFALLFLKRSNLIKDLTENLNLYLAITDPDNMPMPRRK